MPSLCLFFISSQTIYANVDVSGIRIWTVRIEGQHADHIFVFLDELKIIKGILQ